MTDRANYVIYSVTPPFKYFRYARTRVGAEVAAFLVGLRTWWPNPLKASRVTIAEYRPLDPEGTDQ